MSYAKSGTCLADAKGKMTTEFDEDYAELLRGFDEEFSSFREQLAKRSDAEKKRDTYILEQHSKGKRWKIVFKKASKKFDFDALDPSDSKYDYWVNYYETFIRMISIGLKLHEFGENLDRLKETDEKINALYRAIEDEDSSSFDSETE